MHLLLEKDVFNKLNESLLLVSLLKYLPNNFEYLSLFRIADKYIYQHHRV